MSIKFINVEYINKNKFVDFSNVDNEVKVREI